MYGLHEAKYKSLLPFPPLQELQELDEINFLTPSKTADNNFSLPVFCECFSEGGGSMVLDLLHIAAAKGNFHRGKF